MHNLVFRSININLCYSFKGSLIGWMPNAMVTFLVSMHIHAFPHALPEDIHCVVIQ